MFDEESLKALREEIRLRTAQDARLLEQLRQEVRPLRGNARVMRPRSATAVSVVAADGGNNGLDFDPFFLQLIQVVDSYGKVLLRTVVSPTTDTDELSRWHLGDGSKPRTALGRLIRDLGVDPPTLNALSPMIPSGTAVREKSEQVKASWVQVYRDLCEWALLYERICYSTFATDTVVIRDGLLRSKVFRGEFFPQMMERMEAAVGEAWRRDRRRVYLVGMAKHSSVIDRYKLALDLEGILAPGSPRYLPIPRDLERRAYQWQEWARGEEARDEPGEVPRFVRGEMFFARFGPDNVNPVWPVDLLPSQRERADEIFGYLLADARDGFPVPYYPRSLQKAHEFARVADFDLTILQDEILEAIRELLPGREQRVIDLFRLRSEVGGEAGPRTAARR